jgi:perosamine synthetase
MTNIPSWISKIHKPPLVGDQIIPIYSPIFLGNEKKYLADCIDESWISPKGNFVTKFEELFAQTVQAKYAIACSSGTAAIHLSLVACDIKPEDEVIVPTMTMISTAFAVSYIGAKPVFVDCEEQTGNVNTELIEKVITQKTKAIIPVHLYGNPCEMDKIKQIAKKYHLKIIEDAAEAIGSTYHNQKIGSLSTLSAFSLYVNKVITTGQGGIITTNSKILANSIRHFNNYCFSDIRHFWHARIGYNLKLSSLQAAVGLAQLETFNLLYNKKQQISAWYNNYLKPIIHVIKPLSKTPNASSNEWMVAYVLSDLKSHVQPLREFLASYGIETRSFFPPMHIQPVYRKIHDGRKLPVSESLARRGLLLPSGPGLTEIQIQKISELVNTYLTKHS